MSALFAPDAEVTVTITGRVVHSDDRIGGVVVEYLNERGWPERISVRPDSGVTIAEAPAPSDGEKGRRRDAWLRWGAACADEDEREHIRLQAPYREAVPTAPTMGGGAS